MVAPAEMEISLWYVVKRFILEQIFHWHSFTHVVCFTESWRTQ